MKLLFLLNVLEKFYRQKEHNYIFKQVRK